ncbi:hypothetical protein, partial [Mycobacterium tuberculosis]
MASAAAIAGAFCPNTFDSTNLGGGNIGSFNLGSGNQGDINLGIGNVGNL